MNSNYMKEITTLLFFCNLYLSSEGFFIMHALFCSSALLNVCTVTHILAWELPGAFTVFLFWSLKQQWGFGAWLKGTQVGVCQGIEKVM